MPKKIDVWSERRAEARLTRLKDFRTPFERDRARIIHSAAFRRLQAKTQVLGITEGEFHRTRLTHSMEVAQISGSIANYLKHKYKNHDFLPCVPLMEAIGFAHDLGHPPFGHAGEIALNVCMFENGGFEGNGETLRILARKEAHTHDFGLNPTRRTLLGILKYPVPYSTLRKKNKPDIDENRIRLRRNDWKPPKCYLDTEKSVVDWILAPFSTKDRDKLTLTLKSSATETDNGKTMYKALDTSILEIADDIAYGVHDLEDGIALKLIKKSDWDAIKRKFDKDWISKWGLADVQDSLFDKGSDERKRATGAIVHALIMSISLTKIRGFEHELLTYNAKLIAPAEQCLDALKDLTSRKIVKLQSVQTIEYRGRFMVIAIFEAFKSNPKELLKPNFYAEYEKEVTEQGKLRAISDYIACMTDEYATRMYERLFLPRHGNVFDQL